MANIQFKVFSELYGETDAVICNLEESIRVGFCPCGDGCDYRFTEHELNQLRDGYDEENFIPSSQLKHPLNLVALMRIDGNKLLLPNNFRFDKKQYADVKNVLMTAGGTYNKNSFLYKESATDVYLRIINGEKYNMKKKFQFFATPDNLADRLVELADIKKGDMVLEPSAGQGAIIDAILRTKSKIKYLFYIEKMEENIRVLHDKYSSKEDIFNIVPVNNDFLNYDCKTLYNKIIANPPFSNPLNSDIDHIRYMYKCLEKGGRIVSVASKHWQLSGNKKETEFRDWLTEIKAEIYELEKGEFKESGTSISSVIIVINKN